MKLVIAILVLAGLMWTSCSSKTHASHSDKKKMKDYNSIQYKGAKKKS